MVRKKKSTATARRPLPGGAGASSVATSAKTNARARRKSLRLHGTIARDIGVAIVSGRYKPGDLLNGEIDASDRLHVSRSAYREAVRILAAKGLVESRPKVGTRISPRERWHLLDPDVLAWIFEFEPDDKLLTGLFELRRIVEPEAAALAARRRSDADLADMAEALAGMGRHTLEIEEGRIADQNFHSALLRASGNPFIVSLTSSIAAAVSWTTIFKQRHMPLPRDPLPDHVRVYEAVKARDPQAAHAAMAKLIELALLDTTNARQPKKKAAGRR
ncbi:MAG: GntR family transcriptional regulator [Proteobacteria bacterium]|nr:MAG: GntR family transcriptional regulator [Pseudomonadota bacterium]